MPPHDDDDDHREADAEVAVAHAAMPSAASGGGAGGAAAAAEGGGESGDDGRDSSMSRFEGMVQLTDAATWETIEDSCREIVESTPHLAEQEKILEQLLGPYKTSFTKSELDQIVLWKHSVGKNRIYNVKYLDGNTDSRHTAAAIDIARKIDLSDIIRRPDNNGDDNVPDNGDNDSRSHSNNNNDDDDDTQAAVAKLEDPETAEMYINGKGRAAMTDAVNELGKLKGIGPATASAILSLVRPDVFCYLYDEVIDSFEPQRDYKMSNYLRVNSRCIQIAQTLGGNWTTSRVAKTIWMAARFLANNGVDMAVDMSSTATAMAQQQTASIPDQKQWQRGKRPSVDSGSDRRTGQNSSSRDDSNNGGNESGDEQEEEDDEEDDTEEEEEGQQEGGGDRKPPAKKLCQRDGRKE